MNALSELIPDAKALTRVEKLRLIQILAEELAGDESVGLKPNQTYEVWSPDTAFNAADVMLQALADEKKS